MSELFTQELPPPPPGGWTLSNFPVDVPTRTELIDGELVWYPQTTWHMQAVRDLQEHLIALAPSLYSVARRMAVKCSEHCAPEPDISVMHASAVDMDKSVLLPEELLLVAEVVCPGSEERDRKDKPLMYAAMGIPTFWLIESDPDLTPIVYEHQLHGGAYRLMRTHTGHFKTEIPFPIDIPLEVPSARRRSDHRT
jgi:Uma2 family endonuclease